MPSASDELRTRVTDEFGTLDDHTLVRWLMNQGFKLTPEFEWLPPKRDITGKEKLAMQFLIDEWDYGGMASW